MKKQIFILYLLGILCQIVVAQEDSIESKKQQFIFGGYISGLYTPIVMFDKNNISDIQSGLLHNRLNFNYKPISNLSIVLEMRNRAIYGNYGVLAPTYFSQLTQYNGWMPLTWNVATANNFALNISIERLYIDYQYKKFQIRVGRQRINWSQTLVFNPNDIFNNYSFFDFDYPERQGSDAIRLSYYPSEVSAVELIAKMNSLKQPTVAGLYRFNVNNWDIQVLAGVMNQYDIVVGGGFSGEIKGVNVRGEISNFYSTQSNPLLRNTIVADIGADYVFPNSISLSAEVLYNQQPKQSANGFLSLYASPLSAKLLSITNWTVVSQISYPFTPIFSGSLAFMSFADLPAFFVGPSVEVSLLDNLSLSAMIQMFTTGKQIQPSNIGMGYLRLKYNF